MGIGRFLIEQYTRPADGFRRVIEPRNRMEQTLVFGISRAEYHRPHPGVDAGSDAHDAGFQRNVQGGVDETMVVHAAPRLSQRHAP